MSSLLADIKKADHALIRAKWAKRQAEEQFPVRLDAFFSQHPGNKEAQELRDLAKMIFNNGREYPK